MVSVLASPKGRTSSQALIVETSVAAGIIDFRAFTVTEKQVFTLDGGGSSGH
jgi:hypothetical protein